MAEHKLGPQSLETLQLVSMPLRPTPLRQENLGPNKRTLASLELLSCSHMGLSGPKSLRKWALMS